MADGVFCHQRSGDVQYCGPLKVTWNRNSKGPFFKLEHLDGAKLPSFTSEPPAKSLTPAALGE